METVPVRMPDGSVSPVRFFPAKGRRKAATRRPVVVIVPGLGVPGGYYADFALELTRRGIDVAIGELRGQGNHRPRMGRKARYGYHDLVTVDFPALLAAVRERFAGGMPYLLGHSLGGQLSVMYAARARGRIAGLILVASGTPYFRAYGGVASPALLLGSLAGPSVLGLLGGRVEMHGWESHSPTLIADWARLGRTGRFQPTGADIDYEERIGRLKLPVLSISMTGDTLAPVGAARHLTGKMPDADLTTWHQPEKLGHNGWILDPISTVDRIEKWLRELKVLTD